MALVLGNLPCPAMFLIGIAGHQAVGFFHGGVIDCVIRNISETGAALEVASPLGIPETFNLVISGDHSSRPCQVAWRKDKRIGVAFT